jgi:hypothetical protein
LAASIDPHAAPSEYATFAAAREHDPPVVSIHKFAVVPPDGGGGVGVGDGDGEGDGEGDGDGEGVGDGAGTGHAAVLVVPDAAARLEAFPAAS